MVWLSRGPYLRSISSPFSFSTIGFEPIYRSHTMRRMTEMGMKTKVQESAAQRKYEKNERMAHEELFDNTCSLEVELESICLGLDNKSTRPG